MDTLGGCEPRLPTVYHVPDVIDLEEGDRGLWVSVAVEHLLDMALLLGNVRIAAPIPAIVGDDDQLVHVIVQRDRHLVERTNVLVECRDGEHVRQFAEV